MNTFFIKENSLFSNCPTILPKNRPDCTLLCNWVFENFVLADKPSWKALQSFESYVLANKNLCGKLF